MSAETLGIGERGRFRHSAARHQRFEVGAAGFGAGRAGGLVGGAVDAGALYPVALAGVLLEREAGSLCGRQEVLDRHVARDVLLAGLDERRRATGVRSVSPQPAVLTA